MYSKNLSLNRINKDIKEIIKSPLEGIGITSLDNNPYEYIVNIRLMTGIYQGFCLQLLLTISDNYPISPPKILIYPGQFFDNSYHHHIFKDLKKDENGNDFYKFCFDLLENDFLPTKSEYSGWNPSYTISSLLLQVQTFLSDPDMNKNHLPNKDKIEILMKSMNNYERIFMIKNEKNEIIKKVHTWKNPYPEIYFNSLINSKIYLNEKEDKIIKIIKENLTCFMSKLNYIDDNILLGYPIKKDYDKNLIPIPEILSYDSYMQEFLKKEEYNFDYERSNNIFLYIHFRQIRRLINNNIFQNNFTNLNSLLDSFNDRYNSFKSANNEFYDSWLPIYINEEHFLQNKVSILNSFSIIKYGNSGLKEFDFKPEHIFDVLPKLLGNMINKMANNISFISSSFIKCFFQYFLLYKKLYQKYEKDYLKYINKYLDEKFIYYFDEIFNGKFKATRFNHKFLIKNYNSYHYDNFDFEKENIINVLLEVLVLFFFIK